VRVPVVNALWLTTYVLLWASAALPTVPLCCAVHPPTPSAGVTLPHSLTLSHTHALIYPKRLSRRRRNAAVTWFFSL
jgi:hypothetical protein